MNTRIATALLATLVAGQLAALVPGPGSGSGRVPVPESHASATDPLAPVRIRFPRSPGGREPAAG